MDEKPEPTQQQNGEATTDDKAFILLHVYASTVISLLGFA